MNVRDHRDVLAEEIDLSGLDVVDVGCGTGGLVRWLRSRGARPVGVECGEALRSGAIAADPDHAGDYLDGGGEALPLGDASADLIVYSYSMHHVPIAAMADAMTEARRVLRRGGRLYVVEPVARTPETYAAWPVVDESAELAAVQAVLDRAAEFGFGTGAVVDYVNESVFDDADAWLAYLVGIDAERAGDIAHHGRDLRARFERLGVDRDGGVALASGNRARVFVVS